jgi:uncharacterized protein YjdB
LFILDEANDVRSIVQAGAGPSSAYETIGLMPIPGQGAVGVDNPTLQWLTGTESASSYVVYFGTTPDPPQVETTTSESYNAGSLEEGVIYYWRVDQVTSDGTIPGKLWTFRAEGTGQLYNLTTSVDGQGSISPSRGGYPAGTAVKLTATGDAGWAFDHWSGDASGSDNPLTITMDRDKSVTANFHQVPGGSDNIIVRARGKKGTESINIQVNGRTVATHTLSKSYQQYTANGSGTVRVVFVNDNGPRDVQVDYATIDGTTYQAEDQQTNTGVWQNGSCGGSYSEWIHCNGYIEFAGSSSNTIPVTGVSVDPTAVSLDVDHTIQLTQTVAPANATNKKVSWRSKNTTVATVSASGLVTGVAEGSATITVTTEDGGHTATCEVTVKPVGSDNIIVRARGTNGTESITIQVNGRTVATHTLSTNYRQYTANGSGTVRVEFVNDNGPRDVQVDYATIDGTTYQAEDQQTNTGVWQNNSCGGSYSEWINCNGYIEFAGSSSNTIPVTGVSVDPTAVSIEVDHTTQLTQTVAPANATNKRVTWSSSDTNVATVSSAGVVTGISAGSATITVTTQDGGFTAASRVTVPTPSPSPDPPPSGRCQVDYSITNQWNTGFTANVAVTNTSGQDIDGWTLTWTFADGQQVTGAWNVELDQSGADVSAGNSASHWNGTLSANGGSVNFGFQGSHSGVNSAPVHFELNGVACNDSVN